jgi:hypothetical protein
MFALTQQYGRSSVEIVKWVAESMRPFSIVEDEGFKTLMKTGRPDHYIPKRHTVARDVTEVFKKTQKRMKKMLKVWSVFVKVRVTDSGVLGPCRSIEFCDGCMDITKSQSVSGNHCTLGA